MGWPFEGKPKYGDGPVFAKGTRDKKVHAFMFPFGYPIRLCSWEGYDGDWGYLSLRDPEPFCKLCTRDLANMNKGEAP